MGRLCGNRTQIGSPRAKLPTIVTLLRNEASECSYFQMETLSEVNSQLWPTYLKINLNITEMKCQRRLFHIKHYQHIFREICIAAAFGIRVMIDGLLASPLPTGYRIGKFKLIQVTAVAAKPAGKPVIPPTSSLEDSAIRTCATPQLPDSPSPAAMTSRSPRSLATA